MKQRAVLALTIVFLLAILTGCSDQDNKTDKAADSEMAPSNPEVSNTISRNDSQRSNGDEQIAMLVTFLNPLGQEKKGYLSFEVWLNNHKINLASFPMEKNAKLYDLDGNLISAQPEWATEGVAPHLTGKLHFISDIDLNKVNGLKLVIENLGITAKREFTWDKEYLAF